MKTRKLLTIVLAVLLMSMIATTGFAKKEKTEMYSIQTMATDVTKIEGKEITVEGTIVGACKSGCKMWIADGQYKEGDLFTLVRAKDDAFKFDTKKNGKKVQMTGFVVAKYKDYCGDAAAEGKAEPKEGEQAGSCAAPVKVETATKGELEEMTFFATTVKYFD
jgi:hypothetical protein